MNGKTYKLYQVANFNDYGLISERDLQVPYIPTAYVEAASLSEVFERTQHVDSVIERNRRIDLEDEDRQEFLWKNSGETPKSGTSWYGYQFAGIVLGVRSTSAGDVIVDPEGTAWIVDNIGYTESEYWTKTIKARRNRQPLPNPWTTEEYIGGSTSESIHMGRKIAVFQYLNTTQWNWQVYSKNEEFAIAHGWSDSLEAGQRIALATAKLYAEED